VSSEPALPEVADLYLNLLKRTLTNTIFTTEPDTEADTLRYVGAAITHYQQSSAVSMLPLARMDNLQMCILDVVERAIPGDLIETGVWRGGATIFMRAVLKILNVTDRVVWVADSFEGLPEPDAEKFPLEAKAFKSAAMTKHYKHLAVGLEEVERNFAGGRILAPVSGIVSTNLATLGQSLVAGTPIAEILDPTDIYVDWHIPNARLIEPEVGNEVLVVFGNRRIPGTIAQILPVSEVYAANQQLFARDRPATQIARIRFGSAVVPPPLNSTVYVQMFYADVTYRLATALVRLLGLQ